MEAEVVIYKYAVDKLGEQYIDVHMPADFIHVGLDPNGHLCLWAEVNKNQPIKPIRVCVVGTGDDAPGPKNGVGIEHFGSVVVDMWAWHVYVAKHAEHEFKPYGY